MRDAGWLPWTHAERLAATDGSSGGIEPPSPAFVPGDVTLCDDCGFVFVWPRRWTHGRVAGCIRCGRGADAVRAWSAACL